MRKEYKRAVHQAFATNFLASHGDFSRQKPLKPYFQSDELVLRAAGADGHAYFVVLSPHGSGHEAFTIEVGWSKHGGQPKLSMRPSAGDPKYAALNTHDDFMTRLSYIDERVPEFWYLERPAFELTGEEVLRQIIESTKSLTPEIADAKARAPVMEALDAIDRVGLPFLASSASRILPR